ncbi:hypothetical protein [Chryseobacterium lacus]|uniref:hypothetical protein n=1 Tax=Chryseobacterium lacus TaxID=2058346 RepID=UPI000F869F3E|nr:hypothetical protein [Chryseobacterium lacus]RST27716.1 hypothetical protein EIZ46_05260 [Chryseobacterium lacus]
MNNMENLNGFIQQKAELFLKENGEFAPFGAYINSNGDITNILGYSETASSQEIYEILLKGVEQDLQDEDIRASAIGMDGRIDGMDVLVIEIFLSKEEKYQAIYPYIIENDKVKFKEKL